MIRRRRGVRSWNSQTLSHGEVGRRKKVLKGRGKGGTWRRTGNGGGMPFAMLLAYWSGRIGRSRKNKKRHAGWRG